MIFLMIALTLLGYKPLESQCGAEVSVLILRESQGDELYTCSIYNLSMDYFNDAPLSFDSNSSNVAVLPPLLSVPHIQNGNFRNGGLRLYDFLELSIQKDFIELILEAVTKLLQYYNWSNVIILSDTREEFYLETATALYKNITQSIYDVDYAQFDATVQGNSALLRLLRNKRVVFLSMASETINAIFDLAENFAGKDFLWVVHSVDRRQLNLDAVEGMIVIQTKIDSLQTETFNNYYDFLCKNFSSLAPNSVEIFYWQNAASILLFKYSRSNGLTPVNPAGVVYSSAISQYNPRAFIAFYYIGIFICFIAVTLVLLLYVHYRNEPVVKATSISLSLLVIVACYIWL